MIIILISIGSLVVFSAAGYLLYSFFIRRAGNSSYWRKSQNRNTESRQVFNHIYQKERNLKAYKDLIMLTVKCRNLVQKISTEVSNLYERHQENGDIQKMELSYLEMFLKENHHLLTNLNEFGASLEIKLPDNTADYLNNLTDLMTRTQSAMRNTLEMFNESQPDSRKLSDFTAQIKENNAQIIELHKWIISHFQGVFTSLQIT